MLNKNRQNHCVKIARFYQTGYISQTMIAMKLKLVPMETRLKIIQLSSFEVCPKMYIRLPKIACKMAYGKTLTGQFFLFNLSCSFTYHFMIKVLTTCS